MPQKSVQVAIAGRVQGVGFRASARRQAQRLGLVGWVKNLPDGRVMAVLAGEATAVEEMLQWCQVGPPNAAVSEVLVEETAVAGLKTFEIR
ncbi:MAG: acylphosphatase [Chloroflexaceae bacterium]|nr:acylphosphatase [Chloroflexaceae bacterium]